MTNYYFLASLLPELQVGHVPDLGFKEFLHLLEMNFTQKDLHKALFIQRLIDLENMRALLQSQPIDSRGSLNAEQLQHLIETRQWPEGETLDEDLDAVFLKYAEEHKEPFYLRALSVFLKKSIEKNHGFLKEYFTFEYHWRLVLVGLRALRAKIDLASQLQFEDPDDPFVMQILVQKDNQTFEPPLEYRELKVIYEDFANSATELNKALFKFRCDRIREMTFTDPFGINRILGFMIRLILIEKYNELDLKRGIELINQIEEKVE